MNIEENVETGKHLPLLFGPQLGEQLKSGPFVLAQFCSDPAMPAGKVDAKTGGQSARQEFIIQEQRYYKVIGQLAIVRVIWEFEIRILVL
jgi:hypothetical protein